MPKAASGCNFGELCRRHAACTGRRDADHGRALRRRAGRLTGRGRTDRRAGGLAVERPLAGDQLERYRRLWAAQTRLRDTAAHLSAGVGQSGVSAASLQTKRPAVWYAVGGQRSDGGVAGLPPDGLVGREPVHEQDCALPPMLRTGRRAGGCLAGRLCELRLELHHRNTLLAKRLRPAFP